MLLLEKHWLQFFLLCIFFFFFFLSELPILTDLYILKNFFSKSYIFVTLIKISVIKWTINIFSKLHKIKFFFFLFGIKNENFRGRYHVLSLGHMTPEHDNHIFFELL